MSLKIPLRSVEHVYDHPSMLFPFIFSSLSLLFWVFLLFIISTSHLVYTADCPYNVQYLTLSGADLNVSAKSRPISPFTVVADIIPTVQLVENTFDCAAHLDAAVVNVSQLASCDETDIDLDLYTHAVLPNGTNIMPYVKLNVSVMTFVRVERLFVQFRCIFASDNEDKYCHDHSSQIARWGRMIWPCRELRVLSSVTNDNRTSAGVDNDSDNSSAINLPLRFSYSCFNLFGLSQYEVNITVLPKLCRSTFLLTIPMHRQLDKQIREFFPRASTDWSPLVYADLSLPDSVWLHFQRQNDSGKSQPIIMKILERSASGRGGRLVHSERLAVNETGFRWRNVPAGDYFVFVYAERYDCRLSCEDAAMNDACRICPHTLLNFTVADDKFSVSHSRASIAVTVVKALMLFVFVVLTILVIALLLMLVYVRVWRPYRLAHRPAQNFELKERPSVLIVYTDDCEEHSAAVLALANVLTESANANVLLDQFALQDPSVRPSIWLLNAISEAQYVLLIFSECSTRVLNGETLCQRRPFADMFSSAVGYVIAKINSITDHQFGVADVSMLKKWDLKSRLGLALNTEQTLPFISSFSTSAKQSTLSRFVAARFSYSPASVVPEFFSNDVFGGLCLPDDLGFLVARLHGVVSFGDRATSRHRFECVADKEELIRQIAAFGTFVAAEPDWAEKRFEHGPTADVSDSFRLNECLEHLVPSDIGDKAEALTFEEQIQLGGRYGLTMLPTDDDDDDDEHLITGSVDYHKPCDLSGAKRSEQNGSIISSNARGLTQPQQKFELIGNLDDFHSSSSISSS